MTKISPIGEMKSRFPQKTGFTLIEILLVIVILGIIIGLAAPNFSKSYSRLELNKTADDLLATSRWAQAMAVAQERNYALTFSRDRHSYHVIRQKDDGFQAVHGTLGRMHSIPDAIQLRSDNDIIQFYPDGTIDPITLTLTIPEGKVVLSSTKVRGIMIKEANE